MEEGLLTVRQVAARLNLSEWTIRRWLREGKLKGVWLSDRAGWRVRPSEVEAFLRRLEEGRGNR